MAESKSLLVQNLLARPEMHYQWEGDYRTSDNENFYEIAFDHIVDVLNPPVGTTFLDAGCGPCAHSVRLARRGFNVQAIDFSESALLMAREYVASRNLDTAIKLSRESLLDLSFPASSFDYVLCWGVLMHIPEEERAISELARILKPGGSLVISESNKSSLEAVTVRFLKSILRREKAQVKERLQGVEYWKHKDGDALVTRQSDIHWLINAFQKNGLELYHRAPGQFSEAYTFVSSPFFQKMVHQLNKVWFEKVEWAAPAFGNVLIFRKTA